MNLKYQLEKRDTSKRLADVMTAKIASETGEPAYTLVNKGVYFSAKSSDFVYNSGEIVRIIFPSGWRFRPKPWGWRYDPKRIKEMKNV